MSLQAKLLITIALSVFILKDASGQAGVQQEGAVKPFLACNFFARPCAPPYVSTLLQLWGALSGTEMGLSECRTGITLTAAQWKTTRSDQRPAWEGGKEARITSGKRGWHLQVPEKRV